MNTLLAVFTCQKGNDALARHWPYFLKQEAQRNVVIVTTNTSCVFPAGSSFIAIGEDSYINGDHLPRRMLDTMEELLKEEWDVLILAEYDTVFFNRIPVEKMSCHVAGHLAGNKTWGSTADHFYHNPHLFFRQPAMDFIKRGREAIKEGICGKMTAFAHGAPEASPDVFFGYVCEQLGLEVQTDLWKEFSRNSYDIREDLEHARTAYLQGVDVIHGIKTQRELDYITGA